MHKIKIQIGDWSSDGHGHCEDFYALSNKKVEEVREAHFLIKGKTGIDIEKICSEYGETSIDRNHSDFKLIEALSTKMGHNDGVNEELYFDPEEMAQLWIFLLKKADPGLDITLMADDIPTLNFYGYDDKNRHISQVGYGCFHD